MAYGRVVAIEPGSHEIGPEQGLLLLHTAREGLAAKAGHDLTIGVDDWAGTLDVAEDIERSAIDVTADVSSLRVLSGKGGAKPLSERDKREIVSNARRALGAAKNPQVRYVSKAIEASGSGGVVHGEFTINGRTRPVNLVVRDLGDGRYEAAATIVQTEFGIKPFAGLFGALKIADEVGVSIEADLSSWWS